MSLPTILGNILAGMAGKSVEAEASKADGDAMMSAQTDGEGRDFAQVLAEQTGSETSVSTEQESVAVDEAAEELGTEASQDDVPETDELSGELELDEIFEEVFIEQNVSSEEALTQDLLKAGATISRNSDDGIPVDVRAVKPEGTDASGLTQDPEIDVAVAKTKNSAAKGLPDSPQAKAITAELLAEKPTEIRAEVQSEDAGEPLPKEAVKDGADADADGMVTQAKNSRNEGVNYPASSQRQGEGLAEQQTTGAAKQAPRSGLPLNSSALGSVDSATAGDGVKPVDVMAEADLANSGKIADVSAKATGQQTDSDDAVELTAPSTKAFSVSETDVDETAPEASKALDAKRGSSSDTANPVNPILEEVMAQLRNPTTGGGSQEVAAMPDIEMSNVDAAAPVDLKADAPQDVTAKPLTSAPEAIAVESVVAAAKPDVTSGVSKAIQGISNTQTADGVTAQVVQEATLAINNGQKELTLQLSPDDLGTLRIRLNSGADQVVSARLIASTPEAVEILNRQTESLQRALEAQGVRLGKVQVVLAGEGANNQNAGMRSDTSGDANAQQQAFQEMAQQQYQDGRGMGARQSGWHETTVSPVADSTDFQSGSETSEPEDSGLNTAHENGRVSVLV